MIFLRNLDKLANERFNGDIEATLNYLLFNTDGVYIDDYVEEFNKEETRKVLEIMKKTVMYAYGGKKNYNSVRDIEIGLHAFELTREEVLNAPQNPYKTKLGKSFLSMLIGLAGILALNAVPGVNLPILSSTIIGILSLNVVQKLNNYQKFKNLKKAILNEPIININYDNNLNENSNGRSK